MLAWKGHALMVLLLYDLQDAIPKVFKSQNPQCTLITSHIGKSL